MTALFRRIIQRTELEASERGASNLLYIGAGGAVVVILGIVFFSFQSDTSVDDENSQGSAQVIDSIDDLVIHPSTPATDDLTIPPTLNVTQLADVHVPQYSNPPLGEFEFVDGSTFFPVDNIQAGTMPHLIVATDGNPPVQSFFPIDITIFNANTGEPIWQQTLDGDPAMVCRGPDGCSIDGPLFNDILTPGNLNAPLIIQASSGDDYLAGSGLQPDAGGDSFFDIVLPSDLIVGGQ